MILIQSYLNDFNLKNYKINAEERTEFNTPNWIKFLLIIIKPTLSQLHGVFDSSKYSYIVHQKNSFHLL